MPNQVEITKVNDIFKFDLFKLHYKVRILMKLRTL
jgi:hypothetical protein